MLELIGRTDIPVVAGAEYPLVRTKGETEMWNAASAPCNGWARGRQALHPADDLGPMPKASPPPSPLTKTRAFPGPHGAQVSARGHHLRRRTHDEPRPRDFHRPRVPDARQGIGIMGASLSPSPTIPSFRTPRATNSTSGSTPRPRTSSCAPRGRKSSARPSTSPSKPECPKTWSTASNGRYSLREIHRPVHAPRRRLQLSLG